MTDSLFGAALQGEYDLGFLALSLTALTALAVMFFFASFRRLGLIWWSLGWLVFAVALALALQNHSSFRGSLYLPVGIGVMGLHFVYLSLAPQTDLSRLSWRTSLMLALGIYSFLQLLWAFFGAAFANLVAVMTCALATLGLGIWLLKEWTKAQMVAYATIIISLIVGGGSLAVDILVQRVTVADSLLVSGDFGQLPTDYFLLIFFGCMFVSTIARMAIEFDVINKERDVQVATERRAAKERAFNSTVSYLEQSRAISMLSATLAHELNQPLSAISTNTDVLLRYWGRPDAESGMAPSVLSEIERDLLRTEELLNYYLSDYRASLHQEGSADVSQLITSVLDWCAPILQTAKVVVNVQGCDAAARVAMPEVNLSQVFINLIRNSVQALRSSGVAEPHIDIVVSRTHGSVIIAIGDNGPGVSSDKLEGIDKLFSSKKKHGLGLGLSISRWLLERYGGKLSIWSDVGKGFHVQVALPKGQTL